jgi:hypothetical protein
LSITRRTLFALALLSALTSFSLSIYPAFGYFKACILLLELRTYATEASLSWDRVVAVIKDVVIKALKPLFEGCSG